MALVKGTNCGFVLVAPTTDPEGTASTDSRGSGRANKDTAPVGYAKVTEIGWYQESGPTGSNFEVGIYSHDAANDCPEDLIGVSRTNTIVSGWNKVTGLNIPITAGTTYWIAVQIDENSSIYVDYKYIAGTKRDGLTFPVSTLPNNWGTSALTTENYLAYYALVEKTATTTTTKLGGGWTEEIKKKQEPPKIIANLSPEKIALNNWENRLEKAERVY